MLSEPGAVDAHTRMMRRLAAVTAMQAIEAHAEVSDDELSPTQRESVAAVLETTA
jgi:hypothetical protein